MCKFQKQRVSGVNLAALGARGVGDLAHAGRVVPHGTRRARCVGGGPNRAGPRPGLAADAGALRGLAGSVDRVRARDAVGALERAREAVPRAGGADLLDEDGQMLHKCDLGKVEQA